MLAAVSLLAALAGQAPALQPARDERVPAIRWTGEVYRISSALLGDELRLFVGKPPTFARSQQRYPVLLVLDGQHYFDEVQSAVAALAQYGQVPDTLLVGIESRDRRVDFTPREIVLPDVGDRARADTYLDFLERELVPALEASLRAGSPRVLIGHSHSAMLALHAVAARPASFPWAIAIDAPTHHADGFLANELLRTLRDTERRPVRAVALNVTYGWSDEQWGALRGAARSGDLLVRESLRGESHESMVQPAAYRGLQALFADASMLRANELSPLEIDELYRALAPLYGAELAPPEPLMRRVVEDFLLEGRGVRAGEWLERYVATYGRPRDFDELSARVKSVAALGEPKETVASLLALPRATPQEMQQHLGTWKGTTWRGDGPREPLTVRFRVADGRVEGEIEHEVGPVLPLEYVRFRGDGALEFGFKNGMRPRGLITYVPKSAGAVLEGSIEFRGMRFTPPPGEQPLPAYFELERVE
jgi:predicted alpha/beta superfamily hydrolase